MGQMPPGQAPLHARLPRQEPIHGPVERILVRVRDPRLSPSEDSCVSVARARAVASLEHGSRRRAAISALDEIPVPLAWGRQQYRQPDLPQRAHDRGDVEGRMTPRVIRTPGASPSGELTARSAEGLRKPERWAY
jgi:hypothetical protein